MVFHCIDIDIDMDLDCDCLVGVEGKLKVSSKVRYRREYCSSSAVARSSIILRHAVAESSHSKEWRSFISISAMFCIVAGLT